MRMLRPHRANVVVSSDVFLSQDEPAWSAGNHDEAMSRMHPKEGDVGVLGADVTTMGDTTGRGEAESVASVPMRGGNVEEQVVGAIPRA